MISFVTCGDVSFRSAFDFIGFRWKRLHWISSNKGAHGLLPLECIHQRNCETSYRLWNQASIHKSKFLRFLFDNMTVPGTVSADSLGEPIITKANSSASTVVDVPLPLHIPLPIPSPISISTNELVESDAVTPFSLETERYDQTTYYGRFRKMLDIVDPRTLLCSQYEIDDAMKLLKDFESQQQQQQQQQSSPKKDSSYTVSYDRFDHGELWQAKKLRDAVLHPDTNEILSKPFRMSGFLVGSKWIWCMKMYKIPYHCS